MKRYYVVAAAAAPLIPSAAIAADSCTATVLVSIPKSGWSYAAKSGEKIEAITQLMKTAGRTYYCSHGGGCYSAYVSRAGRNVRAVKLDNCKVDFSHPDVDGDEVTYNVEVDRSRNSAAKLRLDDVDNRFLELGYDPPTAGTAAVAYVRRPNSPCGKLARMVLEGNPGARQKLFASPNACTAEWHR